MHDLTFSLLFTTAMYDDDDRLGKSMSDCGVVFGQSAVSRKNLVAYIPRGQEISLS